MAGLKEEHEGWIAVFNRRLKEARESSVTSLGQLGAVACK